MELFGRVMIFASAVLAFAGPVCAQASSPSAPAATAAQNQAWQNTLSDYMMASVWLRRCPTDEIFRQYAAQTAEQILSEFYHAEGMTEEVHRAAKTAGRKAAVGPCTDQAQASRAAIASARAFLMLTTGVPEPGRLAELFALTGEIDESPCFVGRGAMFSGTSDPLIITTEMERARKQAGAGADAAVQMGRKINAFYSPLEVCKQEKGWTPVILDGWREMYTNVRQAENDTKRRDYRNQYSMHWFIEAQRGRSMDRESGLKFPCGTSFRFSEKLMRGKYWCDMWMNSPGGNLVVIAGPVPKCDEPKCLEKVTQVRIQLFSDPKATEPALSFAGKADGKGRYHFAAEALRALIDPNQSAIVGQIVVSGVTKDGTSFADGFPTRSAPPGFYVQDFQDAYSWVMAPEAVVGLGK